MHKRTDGEVFGFNEFFERLMSELNEEEDIRVWNIHQYYPSYVPSNTTILSRNKINK